MVFMLLCALLALAALVVSIRSFQEKGFLLNNTYIWASREEREKMDKKPHYRQTAVSFAFIAGIFGCMTLEIVFKTGWLWAVQGVLCLCLMVYAVKSSMGDGKST